MPSRRVFASETSPSEPSPAASTRESRRRRRGRPTVLILVDVGNEPFDQLAACLRRRGMSAVRVRTHRAPARMGTRWIRDRWLYRGCVDLSDVAGGNRAFDPADVVDVMYNETTMATAGLEDPLIEQLARHSLAFTRHPPSLLLNKFALNAHLEQQGVLIPKQVSAADVSPSQAVDWLGLPLIVKDPIGVAGEGVRVAESLDDVEQAARELARPHGRVPFYQEHITGEMVMYGALIDEGEPLIEHGMKVTASQWTLGPSARVKLFDDPGLLEAGRAVLRALGCRGLAEIGFIRDRDGAYWHIDANCRAWGNMISLLTLGIDYVGGYAALITASPFAAPVCRSRR